MKKTGKNRLGPWWLGALLAGGFLSPSRPPEKTRGPSPSLVWIVPSSKARPYLAAAGGVEETLRKRHFATKRIFLETLEKDPHPFPPEKTPAVCVAVGTKSALWLHRRLPGKVLFSFCLVSHPGALGLLEGRPFLGVSTDIPLNPQFSLVRRLLPGARRVGLLFSGKNKTSRALKSQMEKALPRDWSLRAVDIDRFSSPASAIEDLLRGGVDLVWTFPDNAVFDLAVLRALLLGALRRGVPVYGFSAPLVRSGALLGPCFDPSSMGALLGEALAGASARRERAGTKPGQGKEKKKGQEKEDGPRRLIPLNLRFALNLTVAKRLGLDVPEPLKKKAGLLFGSDRKEGSR